MYAKKGKGQCWKEQSNAQKEKDQCSVKNRAMHRKKQNTALKFERNKTMHRKT